MSEEPNKYEAEDSFHANFKAGFMLAVATGEFAGAVPGTRWKLTYLDHTGELQAVTGDLHQTVETFSVMVQLGYPLLQISDMGFNELVALEGLNITENATDLKRAAAEYKAYAAQVRG